ncbi:MAG: biotin--[acetyl-CoA-carboxylase] ligase [Oscillospiraceae bacterium]|nr:biotin--[acetyl-CoA-carboxylase] ligase [Oscillospiraceae bacterium]
MRNEKYKDVISLNEISRFLSKKIRSCEIKIYDSLDSTNTKAKELVISGAKHGTILIAERQTAGRGRINRRFFSPTGSGVYMSVILKSGQLRDNTPVSALVTAYAAVSVCEAIENSANKFPQIKWVNDVFLNGRKICGILTEAVAGSVIVGVGINFTEPEDGFPDEIKDIAGALFSETPIVSRNRLAAEIVGRILAYDMKSDNTTLLSEYKKRLMTLGKRIIIEIAGNAPYEAIAVDIDAQGRLMVEKDDGEVETLLFGEIRVIGDYH